jgi:hypothetical protein
MRTTRLAARTLLAAALLFAIMVVTPLVESRAAYAKPGLYAVAYLSDGRQQAFRSIEGAVWLQSRWEVSVAGAWTTWVDCPYPPTTAGAHTLDPGIQDNITYLIVVTDDGVTWRQHKLTTDPNSGWTPFYRT